MDNDEDSFPELCSALGVSYTVVYKDPILLGL